MDPDESGCFRKLEGSMAPENSEILGERQPRPRNTSGNFRSERQPKTR